ncbi:hypothetical protein EVAR_51061_1 [Eumeta japonica]|uniref:Uncharacterized protein n=1 Tax=Eumeta variegata TaxID=151549 RepID=A0A4C1XWD4_EUMVA|nr:hypothetical protein EVAR_51061_1 [Eumeta japonica]
MFKTHHFIQTYCQKFLAVGTSKMGGGGKDGGNRNASKIDGWLVGKSPLADSGRAFVVCACTATSTVLTLSCMDEFDIHTLPNVY